MSGENFVDLDKILTEKKKYKIGYAYNESNYKYLKWRAINSFEKKSILAIGSSRVLQLRDCFIDSSFYNGGYTVVGISDFIPFLKSIPDNKQPPAIIINLDQWMFNSNYDAVKINSINSKYIGSYSFSPTFSVYKMSWLDIINGKVSFRNLYNKKNDYKVSNIGLNANINDKGFRNDGSMDYGNQVVKLLSSSKDADDYGFNETLERIKKGNKRFEFGENINPQALKELDNLLEYCNSRKIKVIAFLPPFAPKIFNELKASSNHTYIFRIYPSIYPIFQKYNFDLFDFTDPATLNSSDSEFVDGFHGGEYTYSKIVLKISGSEYFLSKYVNRGNLQSKIYNRKNNFTICD